MLSLKQRIIRALRFKREMANLKRHWVKCYMRKNRRNELYFVHPHQRRNRLKRINV